MLYLQGRGAGETLEQHLLRLSTAPYCCFVSSFINEPTTDLIIDSLHKAVSSNYGLHISNFNNHFFFSMLINMKHYNSCLVTWSNT